MPVELSDEKLSDLLATGKDWGRTKTSVPGVFVVKLPGSRTSPSRLAVEINPVDATGNPTKRRGLFLRSAGELELFRGILSEERLLKLFEMVDAVNPKVESKGREAGEGVIEI
ncbi:hypothetical protein AC482_06780 [miscellaneous Crenarchaeota group-15 archaeon DG-45]|uniref:Uncharacterized protein n=1 Tax=miscellaneous Crenarchaeota group-15 archaeon DG-45 TaxID=1685127 RepID=A0A0M0BLN3_9ARCH|nr:MAG: hypothetical protein AC482_06780 [miscellaneous Crenarchaeota group-15 archaeon DG-45]